MKRDVMKASAMLEHDSQWATILAFDVKVSVIFFPTTLVRHGETVFSVTGLPFM